MKIEIKNRWNNSVIFTCDVVSVSIAVKMAIEAKISLRYANLRSANLRYADLSSANLRYANLDFSCWPLWCGSNNVKVDLKIAAQIAAHFCVLDCKDKKYLAAKKAILKFALTSHRAVDLKLIKGA